MSTRQPVVEMMDPMMVEVMRSKTPAERLVIAFSHVGQCPGNCFSWRAIPVSGLVRI